MELVFILTLILALIACIITNLYIVSRYGKLVIQVDRYKQKTKDLKSEIQYQKEKNEQLRKSTYNDISDKLDEITLDDFDINN